MLSSTTPATAGPQVSLATGQRSLGDRSLTYPLWPVLTSGCPATATAELVYPLEIDYDYTPAVRELFDRTDVPPDMQYWAPLLPPLDPELRLGIGGTPLLDGEWLSPAGPDLPVYLKDESRNLTWSHKDRLNMCTISAASLSGAPGVVVASSGNHGASAAALAARAGLACVVIASEGVPPVVHAFMSAYGATVLTVPREARWGVMNDIVDRLGFHPVSNLTVTHTGHPFGPEGYKTIAYELFLQLNGTVPAAVFVPTGYAELLYGVWRGFTELETLGLVRGRPRLFSCEPAARGPLAAALAAGLPATTVDAAPTDSYAIGTTSGGYRGVVAISESGGKALLVDDAEVRSAARDLAGGGVWQEMSGAASVAGLRQALAAGERFDGPVVCLCTSSGFKDKILAHTQPDLVDPGWSSIRERLRSRGIVSLDN
jgi:threonine synthase